MTPPGKIKLTHKRPGVKRFLTQTIVGWMPSDNIKKHPLGVFISRTINRQDDWYEEEVVDRKTGKTRKISEPLSQHISERDKRSKRVRE